MIATNKYPEPKGKAIANYYFKLVDGTTELYKCNVCTNNKIYKQQSCKGYTTFIQHVKLLHRNYAQMICEADAKATEGTGIIPFIQKISDEGQNLYKWMDWLIEDCQPFNFVENHYFKKYTTLKPISTKTLVKYVEVLGYQVEKKLKSIIPRTFGIIIDGWSSNGEHYLAIFATWSEDTTGRVIKHLVCCGVQDEDPDADLDFTAASLGDYIFDELGALNRSFEHIEFVCADNTNVNPHLAHLISQKCGLVCPLIGCNSHKLNLALNVWLVPHEQLLNKVHKLMSAFKSLKNSGKLRKCSKLLPMTRSIKWSSTKNMIDRCLQYDFNVIRQEGNFDDDVLLLLPTPTELRAIGQISENMKKIHSVSMCLQRDDPDGNINLDVIRSVLDGTGIYNYLFLNNECNYLQLYVKSFQLCLSTLHPMQTSFKISILKKLL